MKPAMRHSYEQAMAQEGRAASSPRHLARYLIWGLTAVVMAIAPLIFSSGFAITLLRSEERRVGKECLE